MEKFVNNASGAMLLLNLIQVTESISGSVVPLAMFQVIIWFYQKIHWIQSTWLGVGECVLGQSNLLYLLLLELNWKQTITWKIRRWLEGMYYQVKCGDVSSNDLWYIVDKKLWIMGKSSNNLWYTRCTVVPCTVYNDTDNVLQLESTFLQCILFINKLWIMWKSTNSD